MLLQAQPACAHALVIPSHTTMQQQSRGMHPAGGRRCVLAAAKSSDGKKTVIITGTSSGLGLHTAKHLARSGDWHIIAANRDYAKTLVRVLVACVDSALHGVLQSVACFVLRSPALHVHKHMYVFCHS